MLPHSATILPLLVMLLLTTGTAVIAVTPVVASISAVNTTSFTNVACMPNPSTVGTADLCTATVSGNSPTGIVSWTSANGSFSPTSCTLQAHGSSERCGVYFDPFSVGTVTVNATYGGDANNPSSSGVFSLSVSQSPTTTTVYCNPPLVSVAKATTCTATVEGFTPGGTVTWSGGNPGTFDPSTCNLSAGVCSVTYTAPTAMSIVITASYLGNPNNSASSGTVSLTVGKVPSTTSVSCRRDNGTIDTWTCVAIVRGYIPGGTVDFGSASTTGVFSPSNECSIVSGSCTVTYSDAKAGNIEITAVYGGDQNNFGSEGNFSPAMSTETTTLNLSGEGGGLPWFIYPIVLTLVVVILGIAYYFYRERRQTEHEGKTISAEMGGQATHLVTMRLS